MLKHVIVFVLIITYSVSCKNGTEDIQPYEKNSIDSLIKIVPPAKLFYKQKNEWNEIDSLLKENILITSKRTLLIFTPADFEPSLRTKMAKVGIVEFVYYATYCDSSLTEYNKTFQFDFTTNWGNKIPIHINTKPCADFENQPGGHFKEKNGNEGWGLGNNWVIWYENFPVKNDTFPPRYFTAPTIK